MYLQQYWYTFHSSKFKGLLKLTSVWDLEWFELQIIKCWPIIIYDLLFYNDDQSLEVHSCLSMYVFIMWINKSSETLYWFVQKYIAAAQIDQNFFWEKKFPKFCFITFVLYTVGIEWGYCFNKWHLCQLFWCPLRHRSIDTFSFTLTHCWFITHRIFRFLF